MSLHRATLFAITALFSVGMTSIASAGCCDWGAPAPMVYAQPTCGGCGAPPAVVYAQPVVPVPPPAPVLTTWNAGCGCHRPVVYAAPPVEPTPIAPSPIYVINQGPEFSGPGIMVPYRTWSPAPAYASPVAYPYVAAYGYGYARPQVVYHTRYYAHPRAPLPVWHARWHYRHGY